MTEIWIDHWFRSPQVHRDLFKCSLIFSLDCFKIGILIDSDCRTLHDILQIISLCHLKLWKRNSITSFYKSLRQWLSWNIFCKPWLRGDKRKEILTEVYNGTMRMFVFCLSVLMSHVSFPPCNTMNLWESRNQNLIVTFVFLLQHSNTHWSREMNQFS